MGTLMGEALARAGFISKDKAERVGRQIEVEKRKRREEADKAERRSRRERQDAEDELRENVIAEWENAS